MEREPQKVFAGLARHQPYAFWLDSSLRRGEARFSCVGLPYAIFESRKKGWTLKSPSGEPLRRGRGNPWDAMAAIYREERKRWKAPHGSGGVPFAGGMVGCWGYGLKEYLERYPGARRRDEAYTDLPDAVVFLARDMQVWDHARRKEYFFGDSAGWKAALGRRNFLPPRRRDGMTFSWSRASYERALRKIQRHISAGDIYQANLTYRMAFKAREGLLPLYLQMRRHNPSAYGACFLMRDWQMASTSPERLLTVKGRHLASEPMKGTAPRGATPAGDGRLRRALRRSEKERAENLMICDLVRNDMGRVCEHGSVKVRRLFRVDAYRMLHQMVSRVEGRLLGRFSALDALKALFPPGSMTGAPKIRAVRILDALEPCRRGFYSGACGYWDFRGGAEWSVVIRSVVSRGERAWYHVGGGIVADSTPEREFRESRLKAEVLFRALGR
jgi:anthranilate/para-aminobenzoate synthase component I